jgi:hypothetical protein
MWLRLAAAILGFGATTLHQPLFDLGAQRARFFFDLCESVEEDFQLRR